jgi:hypothetical protein
MIISLLFKEFRVNSFARKVSKNNRFSFLLNLLFLATYLFVIIYIFVVIVGKLERYEKATVNFMVMFLFVLFLFESFIGLEVTRNSFYNIDDILVLDGKPIDPKNLVFTKMLFVYLHQMGVSFISSYPILVAYCYVTYLTPINYFLLLFYPILIAFAEVALIGILLVPYNYIFNFLKRNYIIQIITAGILVLGLCYLYSFVLDIFVRLIQKQNLEALFTANNLRLLASSVVYFVPVNYLVTSLLRINPAGMVYFFAIVIVALVFGTVFISLSYASFAKQRSQGKEKEITTKGLKIRSATNALFKKEMILTLRNSSKTFSFTSLLIMEPFLMYLVVKAINLLFTSGALSFTLIQFPNIEKFVDIMLILYFVGVINSGGIDFLGDEKETMRVMKTVPVSPLKQILVKFTIPFFLSLISLVISLIVLLATSTIDYEIAIVGFIFSSLFLLGNDAMSLFNELKHPTLSSDSNVFFLTGLYLFIIPILLLASGLTLEYLKVESYYIYLALAGILLIFVVPFFISFKKKIYKYFMKLEVVN